MKIRRLTVSLFNALYLLPAIFGIVFLHASSRAAFADDPVVRPTLEVQVGGTVAAASMSPDGALLVDGSVDGIARLWDVASGRQIRSFVGHTEPINTVAFSPDGSLVATGSGLLSNTQSSDNSVRLWDVKTGRMVRRFVTGTTNGVFAVAFSPDGRYLVECDLGCNVWEVATGKRVMTLSFSASLLPGGTGMADLDSEGIVIIRIADGEKLAHAAHFGANMFTASRDGSWFASAAGSEIRVFDARGGEVKRLKCSKKIQALVFTPDGTRVIAGGEGWVEIIKRDSGRSERVIKDDGLDAVELIPSIDAHYLLVRSYGYSSTLVSLTDGVPLRSFRGHPVFSPDCKKLITWESADAFRLVSTTTGELLQKFSRQNSPVTAVAWSPDGKTIAATDFRVASLWNSSVGIRAARLKGHSGSLVSIAFSPDGRTIATGGGDAAAGDFTVRLWDAGTGRLIHTLKHEHNVTEVAFSPNGRSLIACTTGFEAVLWDVANGKALRRFKEKGWMTHAAFTPDGRGVVVTVDPNNSLQRSFAVLYDTATGRQLRKFSVPDANINKIAMSPDGRYLAAASHILTSKGFDILRSSPVILFDAATGAVVRRFEGHTARLWLTAVRFSADGRRLLTSSDSPDDPPRIWDVESGRELVRLSGRIGCISSASFSPDGRFAATGGEDSIVRLWDVSNGRELIRLISLNETHWVIVAPDGHFDTNTPDALPGLSWVLPNDPLKPLSLETFMKEYYTPRLLPRILNGETFKPAKDPTG